MMFKLGRIILVSLVTLTTTLLLTVLAVTVYWHTQGGAILAVQTGSMVPTFSRGDALVVRRIAPADLAIGDIVSYESALRPGTTVSHRIVYIDRKARTVTTRGDHLAQPDTPIAINAVRGRAFVLLPKFGYVVTALHTPYQQPPLRAMSYGGYNTGGANIMYLPVSANGLPDNSPTSV
jgi:signal peptidase